MHKRIEEFALNAWPALQTMVYRGWLLRFADGYTKRSNSVSAIYSEDSSNLVDRIQYCEDVYVKSGLDVVFKITPFNPPVLDQALEARGYSKFDITIVKALERLHDVELPTYPEVEIMDELNDKWLDALQQITGLSDQHRAVTRQMLEPQAATEYGYFALYYKSVPIACGLGAIEDSMLGIYDIATSPDFRNRGFARQLLLHMIQWAQQKGATSSYLQVVANNVAANRLYEGLHYKEIYRYWYRHLSKQQVAMNESQLPFR
ncbi:hypothetical protein JCM10914A_50780 [Paenibacillus sp. JCM 10914]|uniref:GNAT family N-acetyltransferase n=1 Tax=Paenibacillus sp. JCM 10914 TaxID=1236974 RepID=UPI0003CC3AD0|nr:GNAT family N-acetyltransferase [Paenibacillus sp. JCM 10914]GAE05223.1 hypothetical protein JCM10914_1317 [Paenibacillus sp. JCM 10914]